MVNKEELRDQVSQVTLKLRKLEKRLKEFRDFFQQLETRRQEVRRTHFPPKYFHMKDLVREYSRQAAVLRNLESTSSQDSEKKKGSIARLLEKSQTFREGCQVVSELESIKQEIKDLKKDELEQELKKRTSEVEEKKQTVARLEELLVNLEQLYDGSRSALPWARYKKLYRGVKRAVLSFQDLPGKSASEQKAADGATESK